MQENPFLCNNFAVTALLKPGASGNVYPLNLLSEFLARVMKEAKRFTDELSAGRQPAAEEFEVLRAAGFKSVVNLREEGEDEQPLSPLDERKLTSKLGMGYGHIPVSGKDIKPEQVKKFQRELARLPKPVYVHCKAGTRAGAFIAMHIGVTEGLTGEQALDLAKDAGCKMTMPEIVEFVTKYVDEQNSASSS